MKNSLKNKLKFDFEEGIEIPTSDLWDNLDKKLHASKSTIVPEKNYKIEWLKYAAVLFFVIALGILFKYNQQDKSTKNTIPAFTKVKVPAKIDITNKFPEKEIQKSTFQPIENREFVKSGEPEEKVQEIQKFSANSQNLFKNKKYILKTRENDIGNESSVKSNDLKDDSELLANNKMDVPIKKSATKYVSAKELLFGRELQKKRVQIANSNESKIETLSNNLVQKIKPNSVTLFGILVYSEEQTN